MIKDEQSVSQEANKSSSDSLRKAAVLIRSLPPEAAATLIGRLSAEEAEALRASISGLGDIDTQEREGVAEAMRGVALKPEPIEAPNHGVELRISSAPQPIPQSADEPPADPFQLLRDAEPEAVAAYLAGERPRAAALVLSHLKPAVASAVLAAYPEERQAELLAQMSSLGEADPDAARLLATDLADWVREKGEERRRRDDRIEAVRGVLIATDADRRRRLAAQLAKHDPAMAKRLGFAPDIPPEEPEVHKSSEPAPAASAPVSPPAAPSPALGFDDLERLAGRDLVKALSEIGGRAAVLALAGASENLLRRVEGAVSKRAGKQMRKRIAQLGQTTLAEVEASQRELAAAAERILVARRVQRVAAMN